MGSAINTAVSGLNAASTRLGVGANNIANISTPSFVPQQVDQVSLAGGGVQAQVEAAPQASEEDQMIQVDIASYDYQANLKTIEAYNKDQQSLLNIIS